MHVPFYIFTSFVLHKFFFFKFIKEETSLDISCQNFLNFIRLMSTSFAMCLAFQRDQFSARQCLNLAFFSPPHEHLEKASANRDPQMLGFDSSDPEVPRRADETGELVKVELPLSPTREKNLNCDHPFRERRRPST